MIFPNLETEPVVQVADKTRIDASKTFISKDEAAVTLVEIDPGNGVFVDVTGSSSRDWFLDWEYATDGEQTIVVRVTTDATPVTKSDTISVISEADDNLFSTDQDLVTHEEEILKYVPKGRNSFLNVHRKMQAIILDEIDERGVQNSDGTRLTKAQVVDVREVNQWSTFGVLYMIMQDLSNSVDDKFQAKAMDYKKRMEFHKNEAFLRLDFNQDGEITKGEQIGVRTGRLLRR